jgi:murein DD-endopeptidase MepM/ murein hydrolase activator NlpD
VVSGITREGNTSDGNGWGNHVIIKSVINNKTYYILYAHLKDVSIPANSASNGYYIHKGQQIGTVGNTGWSEGAHLHFEIRNSTNKSDEPNTYDPMNYFNYNT